MTVARVSGLPWWLYKEEKRAEGEGEEREEGPTQNYSMNCMTNPKTGCRSDWTIQNNTIIIISNFQCSPKDFGKSRGSSD